MRGDDAHVRADFPRQRGVREAHGVQDGAWPRWRAGCNVPQGCSIERGGASGTTAASLIRPRPRRIVRRPTPPTFLHSPSSRRTSPASRCFYSTRFVPRRPRALGQGSTRWSVTSRSRPAGTGQGVDWESAGRKCARGGEHGRRQHPRGARGVVACCRVSSPATLSPAAPSSCSSQSVGLPQGEPDPWGPAPPAHPVHGC